MKTIKQLTFALALVLMAFAAQAQKKIIKQDVTYTDANGTNLIGYLAYPEGAKNNPAVLVVHEWWGLNDYVKMRADQLAELGYVAMAVDMYGDRAQADNPQLASELAGKIYADPTLLKARFDAGLAKVKTLDFVNKDKVAAMGYCFGGSVVINAAKLGADVDGVVSFHGNLAGAPADKDLLKAKVLVLHGKDDQFVSAEEISTFRTGMDGIQADYEFIEYDNATHAFTNPNSTATGEKFSIPIAYNEKADKASWKEMKGFFKELFK